MYKFHLILLFVFTGCATKTINNTESPEPVELTKPVESAEGVLPEVHIPEIPNMSQSPVNKASQKAKDISIHQVVEAACGQCQFGMTETSGCDLAVRIDGKSYFVDGTNIHEHGDTHADDGFCEVIRSASVKGKIIEGRFKSESFTLIK